MWFCFPVSTFKTLLQMNIFDKTETKLQAILMRSSGIVPEDAASTSTTFYYSAFILNQVFNQILYTTKWSCLRQEKQKTKHFLGQLSSLVSLTHNSTLY